MTDLSGGALTRRSFVSSSGFASSSGAGVSPPKPQDICATMKGPGCLPVTGAGAKGLCMELVETMIEDVRWEAFGLAALAERAGRAVLAGLDLPAEGFAISLMGCDDARIAALNADFRGKPVPTNVLSWPSEERGSEFAGEEPERPEAGVPDDPEPLGDIAIAWETCAREAAEQGKPMEAHVAHLVVHAVLHLLGYDHIEDEDAALMEGHEVRILASMGLPDPY